MEQIMTITMNAPMTSRGLEVEANSDSPEVKALLEQIRGASNGRLLKSENLEVSTTPVRSTNPFVQQQYNELMNQIAIATSPRELQNVAEIPASDNVVSQTSDQNIQNAVKNLNLSWVDRVSTIKDNGIGSVKSSGFGLGV